MGMTRSYAAQEPTRAEVDALPGATVVEFGSVNCGYCRVAQPLLEQAFAENPEVGHIKVEDASGRRLGRSFGVKLWPTFVFMKEGREVARLVRPLKLDAVREAMKQIAEGRSPPTAA